MTRTALEHVIRAAAQLADDDELIIIGSQSILGQFPDAPAELLVSAEADLFPKNHPDRADMIEGSIGELSPFHDTYGYYAQAVDETTAILPAGWRERLVPVRNANTRNATGWCLEIHDLLLSKAAAWREKDQHFIETALRSHLGSVQVLKERLEQMPAHQRELLRERLVAVERRIPDPP